MTHGNWRRLALGAGLSILVSLGVLAHAQDDWEYDEDDPEYRAAAPLGARWGDWALRAEIGWFVTPTGGFHHYSWVTRGERLRLEGYERWGKKVFDRTFTIADNRLVADAGETWLAFTSRSPVKTTSPGRSTQFDEELYSFTTTTMSNGKPSEWTETRTQAPRFPDATTVQRMQAQPECPTNRARMAQMLQGKRILTERRETGLDAGERTYAPQQFTVLGMRPVSVEASIISGMPYSLTVMLPVRNAVKLEPAFRAAFNNGKTTCTDHDDYTSCSWRSRDDTWNAAEGVLINADLGRTIFTDEQTRFLCSYR